MESDYMIFRTPGPDGRSRPARPSQPSATPRRGTSADRRGAVELGNAHHRFLQLVRLDRTASIAELLQEAHRLQEQARLSAQEVAVLDFEAMAGFWNSDLGRRISARPDLVQRELAFTARFSPSELALLLGQPADPTLQDEFIVAQGVVDLAVVMPQAIWLLDFKTDKVPAQATDAVADKIKEYSPQLNLYAAALERIYRRPVAECWLYFLSSRLAVPITRAIPVAV